MPNKPSLRDTRNVLIMPTLSKTKQIMGIKIMEIWCLMSLKLSKYVQILTEPVILGIL